MEIPDKEEQPYRYVEERLREAKRALWISEEERKPLYKLATYIFRIGRTVDNEEIENTHFYLIDTFDIIYDLVMEGKTKESSPLIEEILKDSEEILRYVYRIGVLLEKVAEKTNQLDAKENSIDIFRSITEKMKNQGNQKD